MSNSVLASSDNAFYSILHLSYFCCDHIRVTKSVNSILMSARMYSYTWFAALNAPHYHSVAAHQHFVNNLHGAETPNDRTCTASVFVWYSYPITVLVSTVLVLVLYLYPSTGIFVHSGIGYEVPILMPPPLWRLHGKITMMCTRISSHSPSRQTHVIALHMGRHRMGRKKSLEI